MNLDSVPVRDIGSVADVPHEDTTGYMGYHRICPLNDPVLPQVLLLT